MASIYELDTFVTKFKQLWRSGHDAHLDIESKAGKAWVGIRLCLAEEPDFNFPKTPSPSRERRRKRREATRDQILKTETKAVNVTEPEAVISDIIEVSATENVVKAEEAVESETELKDVNVVEKAEVNKIVVGEVDTE